jgi:hypothetical protein
LSLFTGVRGRKFLRSLDILECPRLSISPNLYAPPQHVVPTLWREEPNKTSPQSSEGDLCRILDATVGEYPFHALR